VFTQIDTDRFVYLHVSIPPARPVFQNPVALQFNSGSLRIALPCTSQRPHVACFTDKLIYFEGWEPPRKMRSRAHSAANTPHIGLYGSACKSQTVVTTVRVTSASQPAKQCSMMRQQLQPSATRSLTCLHSLCNSLQQHTYYWRQNTATHFNAHVDDGTRELARERYILEFNERKQNTLHSDYIDINFSAGQWTSHSACLSSNSCKNLSLQWSLFLMTHTMVTVCFHIRWPFFSNPSIIVH